MRFIEVSLALIAAVAVANTAPTNNKAINLTNNVALDPNHVSNLLDRRARKLQKRHERACCDNGVEGRIDTDAAVEVPIPEVDPVPVNRNDRNGDSVNVVVNANHN